ncbi:MAG TPA: hypothetical protein VLW53_10945, partial [Candidatus Eisenbacteria bacterium]|nr:hypothetical protein [Candidatus Eisenbacteria bacterium]
DGADRRQLADGDISPAAGANPVTIKLSSIDPALRPASQMRVQLDQEAIEAYAVLAAARK